MTIFNKINIVLLTLFYSSYIFSQAAWYTEDFESLSVITTIDEKTITSISPGMEIWYDGGSDAYQNSTEYNSGGSSYVIAGSGNHTQINEETGVEEDKPYYGSIFTNRLDLSEVTQFSLNLNFLLTNKSADRFSICQSSSTAWSDLFQSCWVSCDNPGGYIAIEYSNDDGITFNEVDRLNSSDLDVIYSTSQQFKNKKIECNAACEPLNIIEDILGIGTPAEICGATCSNIWGTKDAAGYYWNSSEVNLNSILTGTDKDKNIIIRIKSYLPEFDYGTEILDYILYGSYARFFMDDITIYTDGVPHFSEETILPESDPISSNRTLYNHENFDDASDDWGIWEDGGRNAYSTEFLAASGRGICLREFYSGKSNGINTETGDDLGFQKPTYSAIVTENLDFTTVQDLELSFSFVPYQMSTYDPTAAELQAAGNTNLVNDDDEEVLGYVPGSDYVEISISTNSGIDYELVKTLTYAEDFINKVRYDINVNIPGDITSTGALTTTTKIKIQCFSDTGSQQFYIDDLSLYTIGTKSFTAGTPKKLDWASYDQTYLTANTSVNTYDRINGALIIPEYFDNASFEGNNPQTDSDDVIGKPGHYGAVEHTDCDHPEFGEHITQEYDAELNKTVFAFNIHEDEDTDRCRTDGLYNDRQRLEIKAYSQSYDYQISTEGETQFLAWKMKLPSGFDASDKFTHLHQLKPKGGENEGMPTITLTANGPKTDLDTGNITAPAQLNLRYSPSTVSQVTVTSAPISDMEGKWIQILEKVTYGVENEGRYELLIYNEGDVGGTPILKFESYSFDTWKGGDFVRPKWGVYRSIIEPDKIKDEIIRYSDFVILEVTNKNDGQYGDLEDFGKYVQTLSSDEETDDTDDTDDTTCIANVPENLAVTSNFNSTVILTWDVTTNNSSHHNLRYRVVGSSDWIKEKVQGEQNTFELSNLLPNTSYEWQVRSVCEDNSGSNYLHAPGPEFSTSQLSGSNSSSKSVALINSLDLLSTKLYPNPAKNNINFTLRSANESFVKVKLYTLSGIEIPMHDTLINSSSNQKTASINVSSLLNGLYVMQIIYDNATEVTTFIKE